MKSEGNKIMLESTPTVPTTSGRRSFKAVLRQFARSLVAQGVSKDKIRAAESAMAVRKNGGMTVTLDNKFRSKLSKVLTHIGAKAVINLTPRGIKVHRYDSYHSYLDCVKTANRHRAAYAAAKK